MPLAATHILVPLLLAAIIRDIYLKKRKNKNFPLHYVLIAGLGGILPDMDVALFWLLYFFNFTFEQVHKTILHSILISAAFFLLFILFRKTKINFGNKKLKLSIIFLMLAVGIIIHLILDLLFGEPYLILFPFSSIKVSINLISYLPYPLQGLAMPSLDAVLLVIWLVYLEWKHKISDFI